MFSQRCIKVCEEFGEEECEVPLEDDRTLLLTTLQSCFPGSTGLKFKNPTTKFFRAVKIDSEFKFHPPISGENSGDGWDSENISYLCVFPKPAFEAKPDDSVEPEKAAVKQPTAPSTALKTIDLIVLNLSPQTSEADLKTYFETKYGPLMIKPMIKQKRDKKTGQTRCFAFIRFKYYKDQMRALGNVKHKIDGQQVRVALPDNKDPAELYQDNKCFIGRVNEAIKASDLREFFSQFGEVVEISYPKKFKGYAFVTFSDPEVAKKICGEDFVINGFSVCVSKSTNGSAKQPQAPHNINQMNQGFGGYQQNDWNNRIFQRDSWNSAPPHFVPAQVNPNPSMYLSRNNSNFYAQSAALSSMGNSLMSANVNPMNVLSMAMGNLLNNSIGAYPGRQNVSLN